MTDTHESHEVVQLPTVAPRNFAVATDVFSDPASFEHAQRVAKVFASSNLVPPHLKGQVADCMIAYQIARRLNEEPLTVMQQIYIVSGRPGWKTEYVIARANKAGVFKDRITWESSGEGEALTVTAHATLADSGKKIKVCCDMKMARAEGWTKNAKYTSMPEHMLRWRSAAMLIRLYAPEVMLGMPVVEELETLPPAPRDITPARSMSERLDQLAGVQPSTDHVDPETGEVTEHQSAPPGPPGGAEAGPNVPMPQAAGPATNSSSTQQSVVGAAATGQAGSESKPSKEDKEPATAMIPKSEREYVEHATIWMANLLDADEGDRRWIAEKNLRNKCNVGAEVRETLQERLAKKCAEIRDADRS